MKYPGHLAFQNKIRRALPMAKEFQRTSTKLCFAFQVTITADNIFWINAVHLPKRGPIALFSFAEADSPRPAMNPAAAIHVRLPIWSGNRLANLHRMLKVAVGFAVFRDKAHDENLIAPICPLMNWSFFRTHRIPFILRGVNYVCNHCGASETSTNTS
jgi:hypothetical protein